MHQWIHELCIVFTLCNAACLLSSVAGMSFGAYDMLSLTDSYGQFSLKVPDSGGEGGEKFSPTPSSRDGKRPKKFGLDDFTFIKVLGKGSFGKVGTSVTHVTLLRFLFLKHLCPNPTHFRVCPFVSDQRN